MERKNEREIKRERYGGTIQSERKESDRNLEKRK